MVIKKISPCEYEKKYVSFNVSKLRKPLFNKEVTSTIRGKSYIKDKNLNEGDVIGIFWKDKYLIGEAIIKSIELIGYDSLNDSTIVKMEGFNSSEELKSALKKVGWRYHWDRIKQGELKLPLIKYKWT